MVENKQAKETVKEEQSATAKASFDPYEIIKYPLSTEKAIRQIEFENRLGFVVHSRATKSDVKRAVEELFKVKVVKVNVQNSITGKKKAYVKLSSADLASDVSADLGLI
jgi:ribosomal protein uL23